MATPELLLLLLHCGCPTEQGSYGLLTLRPRTTALTRRRTPGVVWVVQHTSMCPTGPPSLLLPSMLPITPQLPVALQAQQNIGCPQCMSMYPCMSHQGGDSSQGCSRQLNGNGMWEQTWLLLHAALRKNQVRHKRVHDRGCQWSTIMHPGVGCLAAWRRHHQLPVTHLLLSSSPVHPTAAPHFSEHEGILTRRLLARCAVAAPAGCGLVSGAAAAHKAPGPGGVAKGTTKPWVVVKLLVVANKGGSSTSSTCSRPAGVRVNHCRSMHALETAHRQPAQQGREGSRSPHADGARTCRCIIVVPA